MTECSILVVVDDPNIRAFVTAALTDEGYLVTTATNGAEALAEVGRAVPALMLLDLRRPVLDGWGVALALREQEPAFPLLVMTAAQDARRWSQEIGATSYLSKPFDLLDLLAEVERLCPPPTGSEPLGQA